MSAQNKDTNQTCPFCLHNNLLSTPLIAQTKVAYATDALANSDNYLLIPKDHIESLADLPDTWWYEVKQLLGILPDFDDYNVSVNIGEQAGQKVKHIHFWLIPRSAHQPSSGKGFAKLIDEANSA
jgi:diadenosine tetraphosphate (Ap4A) HIT family hydrolase